jgi:hypothetical protein
MTNPFTHIPPNPCQNKAAGSPRAALFAALYQALRQCPAGQRGAILDLLETRLGSSYDDLRGKFAMLLDPVVMPPDDKIYGLWLLYLSFIACPQCLPEVQFWIGADLFSDDQKECLRLRGPATRLPESQALQEDLSILASTVNDKAMAEVRLVASDQLSVVLREQRQGPGNALVPHSEP